MLADAVFAIGVLGIMLVILGVAVTREQRAELAFAERRSANRAAEAALCELQAGRPVPHSEGKSLIVHDLASTAAPGGYRWIEVQARVGRQHSTLSGIVPAEKGGQ
jgi:hypothetical protein